MVNKVDEGYKLDDLEIVEVPKYVASLRYTCATCRYDDYSSESPECAWCMDTGPNGGWKTEKGSWEPKETDDIICKLCGKKIESNSHGVVSFDDGKTWQHAPAGRYLKKKRKGE